MKFCLSCARIRPGDGATQIEKNMWWIGTKFVSGHECVQRLTIDRDDGGRGRPRVQQLCCTTM